MDKTNDPLSMLFTHIKSMEPIIIVRHAKNTENELLGALKENIDNAVFMNFGDLESKNDITASDILARFQNCFNMGIENIAALSDAFRVLDGQAVPMVVVISEAHTLAKSSEYDLTGVLASVYDSCRNTVVVLTSTNPNDLEKFLDRNNPQACLFGRVFAEIDV